MIHPALVYLTGAISLSLFEIRKFWRLRFAQNLQRFVIIFTPLLALIQTFLLKPQMSWFSHLLGFPLVFFYADKLSLFMGYIFTLIGLLAIVYFLDNRENKHFIFSFLYIGASLGVVFAGDFLTFFIFWEIMALAPTFLVWLDAQRTEQPQECLKAGYRYLIYHLVGGLFLLAGIVVEYISGSGTFLVNTLTTRLSFSLVLLGIGVNAAFIPLHIWLPDTYPKPYFTTSILMSVYTTKTAVYVLARIFPGVNFLVYMGALMAIYGVTLALLQSNPRKLLSYHIISQVGYMVAGIGIGTALSINGGMAHLFNNILYKTLLFMCAGSAIYITGKNDLTELGGLFKKMPVTTICCIIAALSISGVPGFNGYISKGMVISEAHHHYRIPFLILEIASVGTLLSFLKFTYFGFLRETMQTDFGGFRQIREVPWNMSLPMCIIALLCVLGGLYPQLLSGILPYPVEYHAYEFEHLKSTLGLLSIGAIMFISAKEFFAPHKRRTFDFDYFYTNIATGFIWFCKRIVAKIDTIYTNAIEKVIPYAKEEWAIISEEGRVEDIVKDGGGLVVRGSKKMDIFERNVIDNAVNRIAQIPMSIASKVRKLQTGRVQNYAGIILLLLVILLLLFVIL